MEYNINKVKSNSENKNVKIIEPSPGPQTEFLKASADIVIYGGSAGGGKGNPLNYQILTANKGWTTVGELELGDVLFDRFGNQCIVLALSDVEMPKQCYRVHFSTGATVDVSDEHLWVTSSLRERTRASKCTDEARAKRRATRQKRGTGKRPDLAERNSQTARNKILAPPILESVRTIQELYETQKVNGRTNHSVKVAGALRYKEQDLPLDPYLVGLWLGDGATAGYNYASADLELVDAFVNAGFKCRHVDRYSYHIKDITPILKKIGIKGNKHIPDIYKTASIEQRLALLQGLMDTDGHANDRGQCELCLVNKRLIDDALFLIRSLGIKANIVKSHAKLDGIDMGDKYTIKFLTDLPAFRLQRKLEKQKRDNFRGTHDVYYITKVEPIEPVPCKCIGVSSPDETYLIGESLIPTHNTFALLLDIYRYANYKNFVGVIFRKEMTQVINSGGLWDKALKLFKQLGAIPNATSRFLKFPYIKRDKQGRVIEFVEGAGGKIQFSHLNNDDDRFNWQGTEVPYIAFDELTHFSFEDFTYLMSRNRNTNGFPNLIRATCNPDPDSWVREILDPWIDRETGFPIPEMSGKVMYMVIENEKFLFSENRADLEYDEEGNKRFPKSITFIPSKITDNPYLANDASYRASLDAMDEFTRKQLRDGCWSYRPNKGLVFSKDWFEKVTILPQFKKVVRGWDFASGQDKDLSKKQKHDYSASVKLGLGVDGYTYVLDVTKEQLSPSELTNRIIELAEQDGIGCVIRIPQDPGQAGAFQAQQLVRTLNEYTVKHRTMRSSKFDRARAVASKCEHGMYKIWQSDWNKMFLNDLEAFPNELKSPDIVDALVEAHYEMSQQDAFVMARGIIV